MSQEQEPESASHRATPARKRIVSDSFPFETPSAATDADTVRKGFGVLFDRVAREVQRCGYDLDDVIVTRYVVLRTDDGHTTDIEAESTHKGLPTDLIKIHTHRFAESLGTDPLTIHVWGLRMTADVDDWFCGRPVGD